MKMQRTDSEGYLTNRAAKLFVQAMTQAMRPLGLASAYVPVFYALSEMPEMTQAELTAFVGIEQPTMAATLNRMDRDGLLTRRADPNDGRKQLIGLSDSGREKVADMKAALSRINSIATDGLDANERERHRARLKSVIGNLEVLLAGDKA
ncbi:MarR family winged helix-turn-helix transcriptional regulator [Pelagibacterium sp.]|uniref:MarR family winged helix-turn-helix transcriptional regulator n=1 Tax=Pelagibacterium sp. TaxID=1967288 RepID=UPI003A947413